MAALLALGALVALLPPARAVAPNWYVAKTTVGARTGPTLAISGLASVRGGPAVFGVGIGVSGDGFVQSAPLEAGVVLHWSTPMGSGRATVLPAGAGTYRIEGKWTVGSLVTREVAMLLFATNAELGSVSATNSLGAVSKRSGTGATAIRWSGDAGDDLSVDAGGVAVGSGGKVSNLGTGIAGAGVDGFVDTSVAYAGPNGIAGEDVDGDPYGFAGPAGRWRWEWGGVDVQQGSVVVAAYAPVGGDWLFFQPSP